ncbi:endolysin [Listeria phage LP-083-1]|uniref:Endolysin n=1 Tax=Listeria phage LP-083-1 TaxID=1458854 RepID=A0A059T5J4_9CAUD|nr:endolysin [Listeria phage LP-083-1]
MARKFTKAELVAKAEKKVGGLKPDVKKAVLSAVKEAYDRYGIGIIVSQGYRSIAEQNGLYAQGRTKPGNIVTNAKGGQSNHNFGVAVDFAIDLIDDGKIDSWQPSATIVNMMKRRGFKWGGDWKRFTDLPHFEACDWYRGERKYKVDTSEWKKKENINIVIKDVGYFQDKPQFLNSKSVRQWKHGTKVKLTKHNSHWYTGVVKDGNKSVRGYIYHSMAKVTSKNSDGSVNATINAHAFCWDNKKLNGGDFINLKRGFKGITHPASDGFYPLYFASRKKTFYIPRYMFDIKK